MTADIEIIKILNREFAAARTKNSAYSLRAFARKLDVPVSAMSEVLRGKRKITRKMAVKILRRLQIDPHVALNLTVCLKDNYRSRDSSAQASPDFSQLTSDEFQIISEWYHFAILSLAETEEFDWHPLFIATRLRIPQQQAIDAVNRLLRLGLLRSDSQKKKLSLTGQNFSTTQDVRDISIQRAHARNLELAQRSLENDPMLSRDFSYITMAIDPGLLPEAKKKIIKFRRELCAFLESGTKKEVYQLAIQLFPLTDVGDGEKK